MFLFGFGPERLGRSFRQVVLTPSDAPSVRDGEIGEAV
jgi:hypothetical protein